MNKSGEFIVKFLLYHTYLKASQLQSDNTLFSKETEYFYSKEFPTATQMQVVNNIYTAFASLFLYRYTLWTQPVFTCSKSTMETPEQFVNSIQS